MDSLDALQDFVRAFVPRRVVIPQVGTFLVEPATVRQALSVYALLPDCDQERSQEALGNVVFQWLPDDLAKALWKEPSWARRADLLVWLLRTGIKKDAPTDHDAQNDEIYQWVRERDWMQFIAEYRVVYKVSTKQVLDEAWPLFMAFASMMDRVRHIQQVFSIGWYAAARTGKAEQIFTGAGYEKQMIWVDPAYMDDEWFEKQMKAARQERQNLWGQTPGEA